MPKKVTGILFALCMAVTAVQGVNKSGYITANETWSGEIVITGNVTITSGVVTVSPGAVIKHANSSAHIIIRRDGGMLAEGTAGNRITFTTALSSPAKGSWTEIDIMNLTNSANTVFRYCDFEWGKTYIDIRNESGRSEKSAPLFEYCTFTNGLTAGIYITSGGSPTIRHCLFRDLGSGIYLHGGDDVTISHCEVSVVSSGIINVGLDPWYQKCSIDHCTVYDVAIIRAVDPRPHTGYCYYSGDDTGRLTVTNSICQKAQTSAMIESPGWTLNQDYNGFYDMVVTEVYDGDPGANSVIGDPLFADASGGDFRLQEGSPCIGTASDGTNMGSSQEVTTGMGDVTGGMPDMRRLRCGPNPFTAFTDIRPDGRAAVTITDRQGNTVRRLAADGTAAQVRWDGTDDAGHRVAPGLYFISVNNGFERYHGTVLFSGS